MRYTGNKRENRQIRLYQNLKLRIKENKKKNCASKKNIKSEKATHIMRENIYTACIW